MVAVIDERDEAVLQIEVASLVVDRVDFDGPNANLVRQRGNSILQQSCYDPQFGLDVNFWIQPWSGQVPEPTSPFIDWLTSTTGQAT